MCGICGTYGVIEKDLLKRMCAAITHRGPDDEGQYFDSNVMLGMRRLKVIDLDTGNQPIFNEDRSIAVVYNGEIYNYRENRKYLEGKGHSFYTRSDTETIVHLYEEFGDTFVEKLRGMFSFALWDSKRKRLFIARDRIGIKPLYYYIKDGILVFASELKSLLQYRKISKEINYGALHDYLTYMYIPAPDTIFKDIYKLQPGHILVCENERVDVRRYWNICLSNSEYNDIWDDERASGERLYELMKESIRMHLVSDMPIGVFLSGGMDSGTLVAIMSEVTGSGIKTFSIGFDDNYHNELNNARLIADRFETEHNEYIVDTSSIDGVENILRYFDEPFADSSVIPTYYVSKYARQQITVALSGDGGDEVFGGYGNYKADKIGMIYRRLPSFLRSTIENTVKSLPDASNNLSKIRQLKKLIKATNMTPEYGHVFWLSCFTEEIKRNLYRDERLKLFLQKDSMERYISLFRDCETDDFINSCIAVDFKTVLPDDYLTKVDRMSMANSLEVRVPFLDHKLVEFATAMRSSYKLKGLTTKYLLRKIMNERLPAEIVMGKKKGFSIPLTRWFREDFSLLIKEFLSEDKVRERGYFSYDFVESLSKDHLEGRMDNSKLLWTLICFEIWHKRYLN